VFDPIDGTDISGRFTIKKIVIIDGDFVSLSCVIESIALRVYSLFFATYIY